MSTKTVNIGTSGWNYKHWIENFYPEDLKQKDFLKYYSEYFQTVEINNTFYKLPEETSINNWINATPDDFVFSVKASRYITHMKKLTEPEKSTAKFFDRVKLFKRKLGPILFQIPPRFSFNPERLSNFIKVLPKDYKYVFEFRDPSWFNDLAYNLLKDNNIAFCMYYLGDYESPKIITSDFVYIRFHGSNSLGSGKYNDNKIAEFSNNIEDYLNQGKDVFCYFNNDEAGYAVKNALTLKNYQ